MITEKELNEGIFLCENGEPTPDKMIRLAAYYAVRDRLFGDTEPASQIKHSKNQSEKNYTSGNIITNAFDKNAERASAIMEEVMQAVKMLQPKMYETTIKKLNEI